MEHFRISPNSILGDNGFAGSTDDLRERLSSALRLVDQLVSAPASRLPDQPVTESYIRALLAMRRNRDCFFEGALFADPAWDILLELYAAALGQQRMSVGQLCRGAAVPGTTALRWITMLEAQGLIDRKPDPRDGRRFYVSLSSTGLASMVRYFKTVPVEATVI